MSSATRFPTRYGKYILLDRINSGGMAEVYRAKVTGVEQFQRLVAIKCMLPTLLKDEQFVTMFIDEAKLSAQLTHANICQIYELGSHDEQLYIAMELIDGRDLRNILRTAKAKGIGIPRGFAAYVISKAAEGLDFAHNKKGHDGTPLNLVHRDVSPQNILVSYDGAVKVVDFGIAKAEDRATETRAGVLKGKFSYMAPEQVMGLPIDRRADIFALGAVLYEVLVGTKLFTGNSDLSILEKVRSAVVPKFSKALPDAPKELLDALNKALTQSQDDRFSHAAEFAEALEPLLIEDRTIFGPNRAKKFMQELYGAEIASIPGRNKADAQIRDEDCVENTGQKPGPHSSTQVFESTFGSKSVSSTGSSWDYAEQEGTAVHVPETLENPALPAFDADAAGGDSTLLLPEGAQAYIDSQEQAHEPSHSSSRPNTVAERGSASHSQEILEPPPQKTGLSAGHVALGVALVLLLVVAGGVVARYQGGSDELETVVTTLDPIAVTGTSPENYTGTTTDVHAQPTAMGDPTQVANNLPHSAPVDPTNRVPSQNRVNPAQDFGAPDPISPPEPIIHTAPTAGVNHNTKPTTTVDPASKDFGASAKPTKPASKPTKPASKPGRPASKGLNRRAGFVSMRALGVQQAKVFIDKKFVGWSPVFFHKLKSGKHKLRFDEYKSDKATGRSVSKTIEISADHTRQKPLKVFAKIE